MGKHPFLNVLPDDTCMAAPEEQETCDEDEVRSIPGVEGYDGSLSRLPSDVPKLDEGEVIPAAVEETFICLAGCQYYHQLAMKAPAADKENPFDRAELHRVCIFFHDDEGELNLSNTGMWHCSAFSPKGMDTDANEHWRRVNAARGEEIRRRFAEGVEK